MRLGFLTLFLIAGLWPAAAGPAEQFITALRSQGTSVKPTEHARLNRDAGFRLFAPTSEAKLVHDLAQISRTSALEEAYIHIDSRWALETGIEEQFRITTSDCLVRATVKSSITIGQLTKLPGGLPEKVVWYHVHPSRVIINKRFRAKRCPPPNTWPVLPSSADFSQFLKRAKAYYASRPDGHYADRIVIDPIGVIELTLSPKGRSVIHKFERISNYDTQEYGNNSMPGHNIWPQKYIQRLNMLLDRIPKAGAQLDRNIIRAASLLSSDMVSVQFKPLAKFVVSQQK